jgi:putative DNA primase/helicase
MSRPYPLGFDEWPLEQRNAFFAEEATAYSQRSNAVDPVSSIDAWGRPGLPADRVDLLRGDTIQPQPISWLWPGWLAKGKLHILGGAPGTGKTTITLSLAATVTRGGIWPDGSRCLTRGRVVIWSGEDDPADTLVPRLMAAGADLSLVEFVGDVQQDGKARSFDPARDIEPLRDAIKRAGGASLLNVDPVVSAVAGDSHKNSETRRALQPLVDVAGELGAALVGVTHFSKGTSGREPLERITGSLAFGALARIVMVTAKSRSQAIGVQGERILCRAKSNIGEDTGGFSYELQQTELPDGLKASTAVFLKPIEGTASEILGDAEAFGDDLDGRVGAEDFLIAFLGDGPRAVADIREAAKAHCLAWRSVERAKSKLGLRATREGFGKGGGWRWEPPATFYRPPTSPIGRQQESSTVYAQNGGLCSKPGDNEYAETEL